MLTEESFTNDNVFFRGTQRENLNKILKGEVSRKFAAISKPQIVCRSTETKK